MSGIAQTLTGLTAGQSYVLRVPVRYGSHRAQPRIAAKDVTNGSYITWLDGPWLWGYHDGGNAQSTLKDSFAPRWPATLIGATVRNITDGSSGTIVTTGSQIAATLTGGSNNFWNNGDEYRIDPNPNWAWAETFTFQLPTVARNSVPADCDICEWMVLNLNEGEIYTQQYEVQPNLIDNPSFATGSGDPWTPDGWINIGLDAGDTEAEAAIVHSGTGSIQFNAGATKTEVIYKNTAIAEGKYGAFGGFAYGDGTDTIDLKDPIGSSIFPQASTALALNKTIGDGAASWQHSASVFRVANAANRLAIASSSNTASGARYADDIYAFLMDPVSLTVTPASLANSIESSGLRVDGYDTLTQPLTDITATSGEIRWPIIPRHDGDSLRKFRTATEPVLVRFWVSGDPNNRIEIGSVNDSAMRVRIVIGGTVTDQTFNPTSVFTAGTTHNCKVIYDSTSLKFYVDNVLKATCSPVGGIDFGANVPNEVLWFGAGGNAAFDAVII